jgi:hypothetical protein
MVAVSQPISSAMLRRAWLEWMKAIGDESSDMTVQEVTTSLLDALNRELAPHMQAEAEILRQHLDHLEAAYAAARESLSQKADRVGAIPEQMRDATGRYILLDALTAIVQARAALSHAERP